MWLHAGRGLCPLVQAQAVTGAGAQGHQQVHVAGTGTHGLPGRHIEARTENELHGRCQHKLRPGGQHPVQAEGLHQHRQHQRQGQQQGSSDGQAFVAQAALGIALLILARMRQAGAIAGLFHGVDQKAVVEGREHLEVRAFAGQVDADLLDPGQFAERAFDTADAAGAGHAADLQLDGAGGDAVAGFTHGVEQGRQAAGRSLDPGLFGGEVDADLFSAVDLSQGALDPAGTAGAGHAGNRQVERGGCGHGCPPWIGLQHQPCHAGKVNSRGRRASIPAHCGPWQSGNC
ncbi:hypothetical protein D3C80_1249810 [compost metagenome]